MSELQPQGEKRRAIWRVIPPPPRVALNRVKAINEALVEGKYKMTEGQAVKAMTLWCLRRQEWHRNKYGF